jgi:membrane protein YdbS with pleckstrin-like domain
VLPSLPGDEGTDAGDTVDQPEPVADASTGSGERAEPDAAAALPEHHEPPLESFYRLDPAYIRAEQTGDLIFAACLFCGGLIWMAIHAFTNGFNWFFFAIVGGSILVTGTLAAFAIFWPYKTWRFTFWRLDDDGLEIRKGVLFRHRIIVPLSRVQHADVSQGPLQRFFDLGTLTVHTAGTSNASVELAGLNHGIAVRLRDAIIRSRGPQ